VQYKIHLSTGVSSGLSADVSSDELLQAKAKRMELLRIKVTKSTFFGAPIEPTFGVLSALDRNKLVVVIVRPCL